MIHSFDDGTSSWEDAKDLWDRLGLEMPRVKLGTNIQNPAVIPMRGVNGSIPAGTPTVDPRMSLVPGAQSVMPAQPPISQLQTAAHFAQPAQVTPDGARAISNMSVGTPPVPTPQARARAAARESYNNIASAKASAAKSATTRTQAKTRGKAPVRVPAEGTPEAHVASPAWKDSIMRAASRGDAYSRVLIQTVIDARTQARANKTAGRAPFVPIRDYLGNKMILVAADGTEFVFDMKDEKGATAYLNALKQAGYNPDAVAQAAEQTSRGLQQVATSGYSTFTKGADANMDPQVVLKMAVESGEGLDDIDGLLRAASGMGAR